MAFKVQVIDERNRPTGETLKRTVARLLVRRALAEWVIHNVSLRRRKIADVNLAELPQEPKVLRRHRVTVGYQHHIEPKIEPFTIANSDWVRYLEGYA